VSGDDDGHALHRRAILERFPRDLGACLLLALALRAAYTIAGAWAVASGGFGKRGDLTDLVVPPADPWHAFESMWQRWDALWYQQIALHAYQPRGYSTAFQPLFPLLARALQPLAAGDLVAAELVLSTVAAGFAFWAVYRLAGLELGREAATLSVLLVALCPVGFFLLAPYTEGLFLALAAGAVWATRQDRPALAALLAMAAATARLTGVILVAPLVVEELRRRRFGGRLALCLLPVIGLLGTLAYQRYVAGVVAPLAPLGAYWDVHPAPAWQVVGDSVLFIAQHGDPIELLNLAGLAGFAALAVPVARRLPLAHLAYVVPNLLLVAFRHGHVSPLASGARYLLVVFPCFFAAAALLLPHRRLRVAVLAVAATADLAAFAYWVRFGWVG
jgi:hypothetical protein